jgi:hypothetical protein
VNDTDLLALRLTRWFESRLRETVPPPCTTTQLYGLEVVDLDGVDTLDPSAVRVAFIAEGDDETTVLTHPSSRRAFDFDAAVTVVQAWRLTATSEPRPGSFRGRQRELVVRVVGVRQ